MAKTMKVYYDCNDDVFLNQEEYEAEIREQALMSFTDEDMFNDWVDYNYTASQILAEVDFSGGIGEGLSSSVKEKFWEHCIELAKEGMNVAEGEVNII